MFKCYKFLFSLMLLKIVDENGAGSVYDDLEIDDNVDDTLNSNEEQNKEEEKTLANMKLEKKISRTDNEESLEVEELKKQLEENQKYIDEQKNIQAINDSVADIKSRISDFDVDAVYNYLKDMNKTNPQKASLYNNPIGWENIWYQIRAQNPRNDNVHFGRNTQMVNRDDEVFSLVKSGSASIKDEADVLGKLL